MRIFPEIVQDCIFSINFQYFFLKVVHPSRYPTRGGGTPRTFHAKFKSLGVPQEFKKYGFLPK